MALPSWIPTLGPSCYKRQWPECRFPDQNRQAKVLCWWDDNPGLGVRYNSDRVRFWPIFLVWSPLWYCNRYLLLQTKNLGNVVHSCCCTKQEKCSCMISVPEGSIEIETCTLKYEIRIILPKLFWPIMIKQATGIYSLPQLLHQLWCLGKSAQLRSDWKFGLLHLVKLRYTLSKVIYPNYYKRFFHFSLK